MKNYNVHTYVISMEFSAVNRRRPSCETPLGPGAKKDGCFHRLLLCVTPHKLSFDLLISPKLLYLKCRCEWYMHTKNQDTLQVTEQSFKQYNFMQLLNSGVVIFIHSADMCIFVMVCVAVLSRSTDSRRLLRSEKSATFPPKFKKVKKDSLKLSSKIRLIVKSLRWI